MRDRWSERNYKGKDSYIVWLEKENEELKNKLSKREQWEFRYFWNDWETDIYENMEDDTLQELRDIGEI